MINFYDKMNYLQLKITQKKMILTFFNPKNHE